MVASFRILPLGGGEVAFLDTFALIVLLVLIAAVVAIWVIFAMLPGRIARARNRLSNVHQNITICMKAGLENIISY